LRTEASRKTQQRRFFLSLFCSKECQIENVKITNITINGLNATAKLAEILGDLDFHGVMLAEGVLCRL
jgi:endonuclease V-like protein UPF0215 family